MVTYRTPRIDDGAVLHRIAADTKVLDVNTPYAYVLWCHDFADTSIVAEIDGAPRGFVTGYRKPSDPTVVMVWQVGVDAELRGQGIAAGMLHALFDAVGPDVTSMQTTISPDNEASQRLFTSVANARGLHISATALFASSDFVVGAASHDHQPEDLYTLA